MFLIVLSRYTEIFVKILCWYYTRSLRILAMTTLNPYPLTLNFQRRLQKEWNIQEMRMACLEP